MQDRDPQPAAGSSEDTTVVEATPTQSDASKVVESLAPPRIEQYKIVDVLGRGGMGVVYRAVHATLGQSFAIKVIRREMLSADARQRFATEIEILRRLQHPGIARILYAGEAHTDRGLQPYFVMDYIQGRPLTRYAEEHHLDLRQRLELLIKICDAVDYANGKGVIHRDLKPGNILVTAGGIPKILDFGIARMNDFRPALKPEKGGFSGTRRYASPEQRAGVEPLEPSSDVYTLGLLAHQLLTGQLPEFEGRWRFAMDAVRLPPQRLCTEREFRECLKVILGSALHKEPGKRYQSAGQLGADLHMLLGMCRWPSLRDRIKRRLARWVPGPLRPKDIMPQALLFKQRGWVLDLIHPESLPPVPPQDDAEQSRRSVSSRS